MKKYIALFVIALVSFDGIAAPATDDSIRTLFKAMKSEALVESIYANMVPAMTQAMEQAIQGKTLSDEQKRVMEGAPQRLSSILRSELSWEKIEPMQITIYRESFEQSEIDGLIEFYRSPIGAAFVNKMPIVTSKAMSVMQTYMQHVMPRIDVAMKELLAEAKLAPPN